jgi:protoporphyrinogen/coproporphyrinogen III oxidase
VAHALDGFGFLAPRVEQRRILGTLFSSTMFAGRVGKDQVLLTTFVGGQRAPTLPVLPEADLVRIVSAELAVLLGAREVPLSCAVTRWPRAIPQYTLGHLQRIGAAATAESALPGLFLCASYRGGVAVGDCIASGCRMADRVMHHIELNRSTPSAASLIP